MAELIGASEVLLAWYVSALVMLLAGIVAMTYAVDLSTQRLLTILVAAVEARTRDHMQLMSVHHWDQLRSLKAELSNDAWPATRLRPEAALDILAGRGSDEAYLAEIRTRREQLQHDLFARLDALCVDSATAEEVVVRWPGWLRTEKFRLYRRALVEIGPEVARHTGKAALHLIAVGGLVGIVVSLFLWTFTPLSQSSDSLVTFSSSSTAVGALIGILITPLLLVRRAWHPMAEHLPARERRRTGSLMIGILVIASLANVGLKFDGLSHINEWVSRVVPTPNPESPVTVAVGICAASAYALWLSSKSFRRAVNSELAVSQRLDESSQGLVGLTMGLLMLCIGLSTLWPEAEYLSLERYILPVGGGGFLLAIVAGCSSWFATEREESRRVARWKAAGLLVDDVPSPPVPCGLVAGRRLPRWIVHRARARII